ncbi:type II toxin-antitoxin system ParD family antitoxin [Salipiger pallidus]|nr:type II toxin-antitoxin system ParD family antitoxin [Salipiger pallidus]
MNVSLPDPMKSWVEDRTRGGRYSNVSDYVRDLIRQDQQRQQTLAEIQGLIDEGLVSGQPQAFDIGDFIASKRTD